MKKKKKVVVTGGCGFIGHHVVEHLLTQTDWDIVVIDKLHPLRYYYPYAVICFCILIINWYL